MENQLSQQPLLSLSKPSPVLPEGVELRDIDDPVKIRKNIDSRVRDRFSSWEPVSNERYTLALSDVDYEDKEDFSLGAQRQAILENRTLGRRLRGVWSLVDNATQQIVDSKKTTLATVPYMTDRGTFIVKGSDRIVKNQHRPLAGVYTREKNNGDVESYVNVLPGEGRSHRYSLDGKSGLYRLQAGQGSVLLLPMLEMLGADAKEIQESWGDKIYRLNKAKARTQDYNTTLEKFLSPKEMDQTSEQRIQTFREKLGRINLDPHVMEMTLGVPSTKLDSGTILAATRKLLAVNRGEAESDDRDALNFQRFLGPEDLFEERVDQSRSVLNKILWKITRDGNLSKLPASLFQKNLQEVITKSGLGQSLEEINPLEIRDKMSSVTRFGEGGISSGDAVPKEARSIHPSMFGFLDPLRTPETGSKVGVDAYTARNTKKGSDGQIYSLFRDLRTGEEVYRSPKQLASAVIGFPGSLNSQDKRVPAFKRGKLTYASKEEIDYELPYGEDQFNQLSNLVVAQSSIKGQRSVMASRMTAQALPLRKPEAPLVQAAEPGSFGERSFEEALGAKMGALRTDKPGVVKSVSDTEVVVQYPDGLQTHELYNNFPFNRKSLLNQTAVVSPGQQIQPGQLIAKSNYTDDSGVSALGLNARTAQMSWGGKNFEDGVTISQGFAERATSQHLYQRGLTVDESTKTGKSNYVSLFPGKYTKEKLATIDDQGVVKVGQVVQYGDPLILGATQKPTSYNKVHLPSKTAYNDSTVVWDHHNDGVVTDVVNSREGPRVAVASWSPMQVGDKLSDRHGGKGIISQVVPDHLMPHDSQGRPFEVLMNPNGTLTRTNPAQIIELAVGKIAEKLGHPIKVDSFSPESNVDKYLRMMEELGISDLEDVTDPERNSLISNVATGSRFFMKLHHMAEDKAQARGTGAYTAEGEPAKVGDDKAKRMGLLETNALLAHGAVAALEDVRTIRGQRSEDFWVRYMQGYTPTVTKVPLSYQKLVNQLKASGINVIPDGEKTHLFAMTDKDVDELAEGREITKPAGVEWKDGLKEVPGGLFDRRATGGHGGSSFSFIRLPEPLPNPVMEEPIKKLLGLTQRKLESVLFGEEDLDDFGRGPQAINAALSSLNVDRELEVARQAIAGSAKGKRDAAVKRLGYLKAMKERGFKPQDMLVTKVPVLPPRFRPVSMMSNDVPLVDDANVLYSELIEAKDSLVGNQKFLGDNIQEERKNLYNAYKAVVGLGDPIQAKTQEQGVRGILKHVFGKNSKYGTVQRKLLGSQVDNVGRAVISPNPNLNMDQIGVPEEEAFKIYDRFITRRLVRQGMPFVRAREAVKEKNEVARKALLDEMGARPLYASRAPVLHRYGVMAFNPVLTKNKVLEVSPLVIKPLNADFDGDTMNFHVPTLDSAVSEAYERMLPSRNLISAADFKRPNYQPMNEYIGGLYHATAEKSDKPLRTFNSVKELKTAIASGEVNYEDRVQISPTN